MSFFENKFISSVRYTNDSHDTIEVLWADDGDQQSYFPYYINALDEANVDVQYLETIGWNSERIYRNTITQNYEVSKYMKNMRMKEMRAEIEKMVEEGTLKVENLPGFVDIEQRHQKELADLKHLIKNQPSPELKSWLDSLVNLNKDQENLFKIKIQILDTYKETLSRTDKTNIRKAKTLVDLVSLLKFLND